MTMRLRWRARQTIEKLFPERQIYHRSGGTVRFVQLSPWRQAMMAGGAALLAGWSLYATTAVVLSGVGNLGEDRESSRTKEAYDRWLAESRAKEASALALLDQRTDSFTRQTKEMERRHETLKTLLEVAGGAGGRIGNGRVITATNGRILSTPSMEEAETRESRPSASLESVGKATLVSNQVSSTLETLKQEQDKFLDLAEDAAVAKGEGLRAVLRMTGVGGARILEDTTASGGPLYEISDQLATSLKSDTDEKFAKRVAQVAARLEEMRRLERVAESAPLAAPIVGDYRMTSGFGVRVDPFNRRPAFHSGLDFAGYQGAPISATAPGVVTFVGTRTGYGLVVEIDHQHGFKTRYAHLSYVPDRMRIGREVAIGDVIGGMGNSGRSTGTHLHYEVWYRDKVYDPRNFIKAGKNVYEG